MPLISCIMPTANRRAFVPRAIGCFLSQTWPEKELVILDDGYDSVHDLVPAGGLVRYYRTDTRRNVGAKRNMCCNSAHGEFIAHWDDDDWSYPGRLAEQYERLTGTPNANLAGYNAMNFYDPGTRNVFHYENRDRSYALGTSFFYRKSWWMGHNFYDIKSSEDANFLQFVGPVAAVPAEKRMVATIHSASTTAFNRGEQISEIGRPGWEWSYGKLSELPEEYLRSVHAG